jgi:ketosteroid isomerase-like protein
MKGINELDEVMRQNVEYERQVFKDLLWKNFEMWSETQKIDHLYALIEQYFSQVLSNDFHKI